MDTLWTQINAGDKTAFMLMYDTYYQQLYAFGASVYPEKDVVKDCIHDMFCELWDTRSQNRQVSNTRSYLFTYLKRKIIKQINVTEGIDNADIERGRLGVSKSYEEVLIKIQKNEEDLKRLTSYLQKLTPTQHEVIRIRFYENLSYTQIASALNIETRTAYNHAHEALKLLKGYFKPAFLIAFSSMLNQL